MTKLPLTASATFTDPGIPDRQSAMLAWGDGVVDPSSAFTTFIEAFGGVFGNAIHQHRYATPGVVTVQLTVTDDDGGVGSVSATIEVVSPEQALVEMIAVLDGVIANTSNRTLRKYLGARAAGAGRLEAAERRRRAADGAGRARPGRHPIRVAGSDWLEEAQAGGSDVGVIIKIAEQLAMALSAE